MGAHARRGSGARIAFTAAAGGLAAGFGFVGAVTLAWWWFAATGAFALAAAVVWWMPVGSPRTEPQRPSNLTTEAYEFTEWNGPAEEAARYPDNLVEEVFDAPRVYAQEAAAPPPRAPRTRVPAAPPAAKPSVPYWEPGAKPAPAAFQDPKRELIEFEEVHEPAEPPVVVSAPAAPAPVAAAPTSGPHREWAQDLSASRYAAFYQAKPAPASEGLSEELKRRRRALAKDLPLVGGMLLDADPKREPAAPAVPAKTRGKCSKCNTYLWAPAKRPLRVRCPKCGHEAKLY